MYVHFAWKGRPRNDLYCVGRDVKLLTHSRTHARSARYERNAWTDILAFWPCVSCILPCVRCVRCVGRKPADFGGNCSSDFRADICLSTEPEQTTVAAAAVSAAVSETGPVEQSPVVTPSSTKRSPETPVPSTATTTNEALPAPRFVVHHHQPQQQKHHSPLVAHSHKSDFSVLEVLRISPN